ncbi:MAG: imidazolonepropionase [Xanthomonadales bacterium]|nr:imidazolonepropionase [Gammaproteobacteria bacterium]NNK03365.1 imidazolonepropionase [Xanthomonadales bacterium]
MQSKSPDNGTVTVLNNIGQLATCSAAANQQNAGLINNAALAVENDRIAWVGFAAQLPDEYANADAIDCGRRLVIPGLIDCHTHLCFGGWRGDEFEMRIQGKSYQEIANSGGGIRSTVRATRSDSADRLSAKALGALKEILALGVTTLECKSGYGLELESELKQLRVYRDLDRQQPVDLVPTFLGAHMVPEEYSNNREGYMRLLCEDLIPAIAEQKLARFCDIFVEQGAFELDEARVVLETAQRAGFGLKVHADQLSNGGGARLAAAMGAVSAEHLEYSDPEGIAALARSGTVAVSLPLASLYLRESYMPAREMLEAGVRVAVATDFNPGSAPSSHLPLAMTLACINQQMTPQEVLMAATTIAARAVASEHRIGSLLPGFEADIAIIDAPSLNHWLYHFRANACCGVIKSGQWQHRLF